MLPNRPLALALHCTGCRASILESVFSIARPCLKSPVRSNTPRNRGVRHQSRKLHGTALRQSEQLSQSGSPKEETSQRNSAVLSSDNDALRAEAPTTQSLPWYLQAPSRQEDPPSLAERQRVSDLPSDSPPVLQPLLEYISVDLGLDDLSLLDLRKLDPPPALGANLFMIIGSARSEKHLHVSADRLCRWLRSSYQLHPYADGLLGRNELKLKMRRKARRSRLLGNVGALDTRDTDDGIRTGWVCVNIGRVEDSNASEDASTSADFVGFGRRFEGVRVVVQMFTEEKRVEVDLEGLWGGILRNNAKKLLKESAHLEDETAMTKLSVTKSFGSPPRSVQAHAMQHSLSHMAQATLQRGVDARGFHSSVRRASTAQHDPDIDHHDAVVGMPTKTAPTSETLRLGEHIEHLRGLSRVDALEALGQDANDTSSTTFLSAFYRDLPEFPETTHWECMIDLYCHAIALGHKGYPKSGLIDLIYNMQVSGIDMSEGVFTNAFHAILQPNRSRPSQPYTEQDLHMAIKVLEETENHGYDALTEEIFLSIHDVLTQLYPAAPSPSLDSDASSSSSPSHEALNSSTWPTRLSLVMDLAPIHLTRDSSYLLLLRTYARLNHWPAFWETWRRMPRTFYPRSATLYTFLFRTIAEKGHQREAMKALRLCVPEMPAERPKVALAGEVAQAVMECLLVAEPEVGERIREVRFQSAGTGRAGEWVGLWKRCQRVLRREGKEDGQRGQEGQAPEREGEVTVQGQPAVD